MQDYKIFAKRRKIKQFIIGSTFLPVLAGGWRYPLLGYFIPFCMVLGIAIALRKGRKWCDWFCPRGSFNDTLLKALSPQKEIPKVLKSLWLRIVFLSFLMLMMVYQIIVRWPSLAKIGMFFVILLTVTTVLGIILALVFHQRTWCCFCPIGSLGNWLGRGKYPLKIDSQACITCKLCRNVCPIQVSPYEFKDKGIQPVRDGDCLKCRSCVRACPKKALTLGYQK